MLGSAGLRHHLTGLHIQLVIEDLDGDSQLRSVGALQNFITLKKLLIQQLQVMFLMVVFYMH